MRVLVNSLTADGPRTGIGHYTWELVAALRAQQGESAVATFPVGWLRRARACWARVRPQEDGGTGPARAPNLRQRFVELARMGGQTLLRSAFRRAARAGCDLYHEPNFIALPCELPTVATVHDLSVLLHPEWHPADRVRHFEKEFHAGLQRCRHLFAISEAGKADIVRHLGWPADRVTVTPMGVRGGLARVHGEELKASLDALGLAEGYLLHVGTLEPRKNVRLLMRAYGALPSEIRDRHPLVLVGGRGWNSADVHDYLEREGRARNVRWLGYVPDHHFAALYSGARALLFPTFYEGFGIPVIEMFACGGAVVASTAAAIAEVASGRAHLVAPEDEAGWHDAMKKLCREPGWAADLGRGTPAIAARFTWARCAERSYAGYQHILQPTRPALAA